MINPNGKSAYAALGWGDSQGSETGLYFLRLFTTNQSTGELTNTNKVVASYTNEYTGFLNFSFGQQGIAFFGKYLDDGRVTFNGVPAAFAIESGTFIRAIVPSGVCACGIVPFRNSQSIITIDNYS